MSLLAALALWLVQPAVAAAAPAASDTAHADASYRREVEAWRQKRLESLKADGGWLTVVGLHWLKPGANAFGAASGNDLVLPAHGTPPHAGVFTLEGGHVSVEVAREAPVRLGGRAVTRATLATDADGHEPDVLALGSLTLQIIDRSGRLGVRVKDRDSEARRAFHGLKWYPVKPELRVTARFIPRAKPATVDVPTIIGVTEAMPSPGTAELALEGKTVRLTAVVEPGDPRLFFIFRDATSAHTTYGAGRFLHSDPPRNGKVILDFNEAYSPPCAFTAYATCPMPPSENRLPISIEAGEMFVGH